MRLRHFLSLSDISSDECHLLIERGIEIKAMLQGGEPHRLLQGKTLAMIFETTSTRTRVSFEAGMAQLGGHAIFMPYKSTQLRRGEPIEDVARVLSEMVDAIMIRTFNHEDIKIMSKYATVPIINGLSDMYHPCQLLADMQTYYEHRGAITGKTVAWLGDGNNMCHSYINAARLYDFNLRFSCPAGYCPDDRIVSMAQGVVEYCPDPKDAVKGAHLVVTDVWASMGQENEADKRTKMFMPYQVNQELMALANDNALFMHCLPAHREAEVTADVLEGKQSVVWDEAGNRLHAQKALLEFLLAE